MVPQRRNFGTTLATSCPRLPAKGGAVRVWIMEISNTISPLGQTPDNWVLDRPVQQIPDAGQNLPEAAQAAQYNFSDLVSTPRASLTASATAVATQSVDSFSSWRDSALAISAYQSQQNAKGLYGYQSTLGAPWMG